MTAQELKKYIYEHKKIEYILEKIGCNNIKYDENHNYWTSTQPNGNNNMGVVIHNSEYLNYYSYSRGINIDERHDIFYLVQQSNNITFAETMKYIHKLLGLDYRFNKNKKEESKINKYDPLAIFKKAATKKKFCNVLDFNIIDERDIIDFTPGLIHIDIFREGLIKKSINKFNLGYSYRLKRTIYPIRYWLTGDLIAYTGRSSIPDCELFDIRKYYISKGYNKSLNLYGLWENYKDIEEAGHVTVVESEKSVVKRDSRNDPTCVALSGKTISEEQVRILLGLNIKEIVICLDTDVEEVEIWSICEHFYHLRKISYIRDKHGLLKGEKDSPCDANNKVYQYLFKHRINYDSKLHMKYLSQLKSNSN